VVSKRGCEEGATGNVEKESAGLKIR